MHAPRARWGCPGNGRGAAYSQPRNMGRAIKQLPLLDKRGGEFPTTSFLLVPTNLVVALAARSFSIWANLGAYFPNWGDIESGHWGTCLPGARNLSLMPPRPPPPSACGRHQISCAWCPVLGVRLPVRFPGYFFLVNFAGLAG